MVLMLLNLKLVKKKQLLSKPRLYSNFGQIHIKALRHFLAPVCSPGIANNSQPG